MGASRIAPVALVKPARNIATVDVVAVAARDRSRAEQYAAKHGIPRVLDSYEALISDPAIDAVYIPLPNSHHGQWTIRALQAGKHVLCEKPIASNAKEARQMVETAEATDRCLMEAFHWRYHDLAKRMIALIQAGEIGTIQRVEASMCIPMILPGDIRYQLELGGGAMMDVGTYTVSLLRHLSGEEPTVVAASAAHSSPGVDRLMTATLKFPSGATGWLRASLFSIRLLSIWVRVIGDKGELYAANPIVPHMGSTKLKIQNKAGKRSERFGKPSTYDRQLQAFVNLVRHGILVPTDGWDGVRNMQVIDDIYRAAGMAPRSKT